MFKFNLLILLFLFSTQSFAQKYHTIDLSYFIETDTLFIEYIKKAPTKDSSYTYVNKISAGTTQYQEIQKTMNSFNLKWEKMWIKEKVM